VRLCKIMNWVEVKQPFPPICLHRLFRTIKSDVMVLAAETPP